MRGEVASIGGRSCYPHGIQVHGLRVVLDQFCECYILIIKKINYLFIITFNRVGSSDPLADCAIAT